MIENADETSKRLEMALEDARRYLGKHKEALSPAEEAALLYAIKRQFLSRNIPQEYQAGRTLGARAADAVARFGGSWPFIAIFILCLGLWALVNLAMAGDAFDPYPFIFLNLLLSMLAAIQAPIIMMSQNRQAERDRLAASHDYEVNLKAEIEIMALHDKLDQMRDQELRSLIERQNEQIALLGKIIRERGGS